MIDPYKRNIGVNFTASGTASVRLWAPLAEAAGIRISGTVLDLLRNDHGYWETETDKLRPGMEYTCLIDGKEIPDPASLTQPGGVHGASAAADLNDFDWSDGNWVNPGLSSYIIYELHTGTFTPSGTFSELLTKLDYLVDLGITAIEIMPVAQFPGERNWGYDGVFPFAVQHTYGGHEGLRRLVSACHEKGLAVILDVVYNHLGPEGNYFSFAGPYFTDKYQTPWGSAINFDDAWSDGVRDYFIENALMWFRDFHIDALRLDAVHAIKDFGARHFLQELREYTVQLQKITGRNFYLIAESDLNDNRYINPPEVNGYGMDAQWIDEFHHALRVAAGEPAAGYYTDFRGLGYLEKAFRDAYVYDGQYSVHRHKTFGRPAKDNPGEQFVVFSQNHDQVGNRMRGERTAQLLSTAMQRLLAGAVLCSPYIPMLFMGEEYGETHPFLFFTSHSDPELIEAVRKGRSEEFKDFHEGNAAPDPQDESSFIHSKLQWDLAGLGGHHLLLAYYKMLIALRKRYAPLGQTDRRHISVTADTEKNCLLLKRWAQEHQVLCLMNFSGKVQYLQVPDDKPQWKKIMDSADPVWGGPAASPEYLDAGQQVAVRPESILVYTNKYV